MTLPVRVRRRAELDLDEAYAWYESRAEGLGEAFLRAAEACLARIARHPEAEAERPPVGLAMVVEVALVALEDRLGDLGGARDPAVLAPGEEEREVGLAV